MPATFTPGSSMSLGPKHAKETLAGTRGKTMNLLDSFKQNVTPEGRQVKKASSYKKGSQLEFQKLCFGLIASLRQVAATPESVTVGFLHLSTFSYTATRQPSKSGHR